MLERSWGNGFAFAGLSIAVGGILVQSPQIFGLTSKDSSWLRIIFFASLMIAALAIFLLRPTKDTKNMQRLHGLRSQLSDRDIAFLKVASSRVTYPKTVSDETCLLVPPNETWNMESESDAVNRAKKLILLGLLEWRFTEVESTNEGKALVSYDEFIKFSNKSN